MKFKLGYELRYRFPQPTPVITQLTLHYSRQSDLLTRDDMIVRPSVPVTGYRDLFGNWCGRFLAPAGQMVISADFTIRDSGAPDALPPAASQVPVENLPEEALAFLLPSRYCDSDRLLDLAWEHFGSATPGLERVQAVCDFVHRHLTFDYAQARPTRSAYDAYQEQVGVCRDFAHLGVAFCRALNIPARYCAGFLSDAGTEPPYPPGDFAGWFDAYLGGAWHSFDPRNNTPRIGRFLLARGRDAADVAITTTFGPNTLEGFRVWADEVPEPA